MDPDICDIPLVCMLALACRESDLQDIDLQMSVDEIRIWVGQWVRWYCSLPQTTRDKIHALLVEAAESQ